MCLYATKIQVCFISLKGILHEIFTIEFLNSVTSICIVYYLKYVERLS